MQYKLHLQTCTMSQ